MSRYVLTVNLKDDPEAIALYRYHHERVWPDVLRNLREAGVEQMQIHLLGRQLVMVVDLADGLDLERTFTAFRASTPTVIEWEQLMTSLQEPSPHAPAGAWWTIMEPVFRLSDQELDSARVVQRPATS